MQPHGQFPVFWLPYMLTTDMQRTLRVAASEAAAARGCGASNVEFVEPQHSMLQIHDRCGQDLARPQEASALKRSNQGEQAKKWVSSPHHIMRATYCSTMTTALVVYSGWSQLCMHASARQHLHHVKGRQEGGGVFYLLFLLAYAFTVPITFLT
jgi:hypothetical protein